MVSDGRRCAGGEGGGRGAELERSGRLHEDSSVAGRLYQHRPLIGHSALRRATGALGDRPPTDDQLANMRILLETGMEQGAFGMSTGLTVPPSSYADTDEIVSLASVMSPYDHAFYATHARVWAGWHINAIEEAVEIG